MDSVIIHNSLTLKMTEEGNDYLHDSYHGPVDKEITAIDLKVVGQIPPDLDGVYIRNSHNPVEHSISGRYHWFDGDGMVHGVAFKQGQADYRNRMVMTEGYLKEQEAGEGLYPGLRDGFQAEDGLKNNSGTDVLLHNGEFKTMFSRCGKPYRLDPVDFHTIGAEDFNGDWVKGVSAHSKVDERTGEFLFFNYSFQEEPYMQYGVVDKNNKLICATDIELPGPRLPHDCWITENFTIVHDLPLFWDPELLVQKKKKLLFDQTKASRFGVIPRYGKGADVVWFECEPTYILHTVNAYEEDDCIIAYAYKQLNPLPSVPAGTSRVKIQNYFLSYHITQPRLTEYRFNLKTGEASERIIDDSCAESPGINSAYLGIKNRYSYNALVPEIPFFLHNGIQKFDYQEMRETDRYMLPEGKFMQQPVFAPRADSKDEDDGYLIAYVGDKKETEVYIWDAKKVSEGPISRVQLPQWVPFGSHAYWGRGSDIREAQERNQRNKTAP